MFNFEILQVPDKYIFEGELLRAALSMMPALLSSPAMLHTLLSKLKTFYIIELMVCLELGSIKTAS